MIYPSIGELVKKTDSKFTLVVVAAKRARQLTDGANRLIECGSENSVTIATNEIINDKITYVRTKSGIK